jgi:hypothetical protein
LHLQLLGSAQINHIVEFANIALMVDKIWPSGLLRFFASSIVALATIAQTAASDAPKRRPELGSATDAPPAEMPWVYAAW